MCHRISEYPSGGGLPNKGRFGCAAVAKSSPGKVSLSSLISCKKCPKNLITEQVFMKFRLQKQNFSANRPLFVHSYKTLHIFVKYSKSLMRRQKLIPEKPNARVNIAWQGFQLKKKPKKQEIFFQNLCQGRANTFVPTFIRESPSLDIHSPKLENSSFAVT